MAGDPAAAARRFLDGFSAGDLEAMRSSMAADVVAQITNAAGGADEISGRDELLARIEAMNLPAVSYSVELTQPPVPIDPDRVLVMVEIRAERPGHTLHNFAAHLLRFRGGELTEWHMVDAKPTESDRFWG